MNEKKAPNVKNADRLAATNERCLSAAAGTSGACDLRSAITKAANSTPARANSRSVDVDVQPWSAPRFSAYTSARRPPVIVVAPAPSNLLLLRCELSRGSTTNAIAISTTPIGTLMKNTQRQPGPSVSRPLAITPIDAEVPPTAP